MDLDRSYLTRAFALAYFFHPDRATALQVVTRALGKLGLAERVQARRRYYSPRGRRLLAGALSARRTKVTVERAQLLQRLVLFESAAAERWESDSGGPPYSSDEHFALSFVKHLVWNASRRNSLYVTVALGRVLHSYTTTEVQDLFSAVVQDPDRVPEGSYLRAVKAKLLRDAKERYGELLQTRVAERGEEVFATIESDPRLFELVRSCLEHLTPWETSCSLPPGFTPSDQVVPSLRSLANDPDGEHPIEVRRMHALIHPHCFWQLLGGLGLASPSERLTIPRPFRRAPPGPMKRENGGEGDRGQPPTLSDRDLDDIRKRSAPAKGWPRGPVSRVLVRADGRERASVDLRPGATAKFDLEEDATILEFVVVGEHQQVAALHLLSAAPPFRPSERRDFAVDVGTGHELSLSLTWFGNPPLTPSWIGVEVACRRSSLVARVREALPFASGNGAGRGAWAVRTASALALLVLASLAVVRFRGDGERPARPPAPAATTRSVTSETTRGGPIEERPATLGTVTRVHVGRIAGASQSRPLADSLVRQLRATGRFRVVEDEGSAQAQLRALVGPTVADAKESAASECTLALELVDATGGELWSTTATAGDCESAVDQAVEQLLLDARTAALD